MRLQQHAVLRVFAAEVHNYAALVGLDGSITHRLKLGHDEVHRIVRVTRRAVNRQQFAGFANDKICIVHNKPSKSVRKTGRLQPDFLPKQCYRPVWAVSEEGNGGGLLF